MPVGLMLGSIDGMLLSVGDGEYDGMVVVCLLVGVFSGRDVIS